MQTAEPLVLLRVPMDGRAASFRLQSGPEAGISRIKFAVIVIVRLDRATSASSPSTSASFTKGHFMRQDGPPLLPFNRIRTLIARAPPWPQFAKLHSQRIHITRQRNMASRSDVPY